MSNYYKNKLSELITNVDFEDSIKLELSPNVFITIYDDELDTLIDDLFNQSSYISITDPVVEIKADLVDDLIINCPVKIYHPVTKIINCYIIHLHDDFIYFDYSLIYAEEAEISLAKIMQLSYNNITIPYVKSLWMGEIIPAKNIREVFFNCFLIEFFDCSSFNYKEYLDENFIIKIVNTTTYDKDKIIISKNHKYLHVLDYSVNRILVNDEYYEIKTGYYLGPFYNFIKQLPFEYEYESLKKNANKV